MNRKALLPLVLIAFISALVAYVVSGLVFKPIAHKSTVPGVQAIKADLPDVKNDSSFNSIFYNGAVDATQPVQIGNSSNQTPFNGGQ